MSESSKNFLDFQYAVAQDMMPERVSIGITVHTNLSEDPSAVKIDQIQAHACAIEMAAKDLHYRAKGKPFYGVHLLADLVHKIGDHKDDLNEVFYLGDKGMPPPLMCYTTANACKVLESFDLSTDRDEDKIVDGLRILCKSLVSLVEEAKKTYEYKAGVQAILDNISADALQADGLLHRTSTEVDIQASGIEVKERAEASAENGAGVEVTAPTIVETQTPVVVAKVDGETVA